MSRIGRGAEVWTGPPGGPRERLGTLGSGLEIGLPPGAVQSGEVNYASLFQSGYGTLNTASGMVVSGVGTWAPSRAVCHCCGGPVGVDTFLPVIYVNGSGLPPNNTFCPACAGWDDEKKRFLRREDYIRMSLPLSPKTPDGIVADWLDDHGRSEEANYVRSLDGSRRVG